MDIRTSGLSYLTPSPRQSYNSSYPHRLIAGFACGGTNESPTTTPSPLPDLVIDDIALFSSQDCYSPSFYRALDVRVKNTGVADAGPFEVAMDYLHTHVIASQNISGLAAGQETTLRFEYYYFDEMTATADAAAQVMESNESNNELAQTFMDPPPPTPCPSQTPTANEVNVDASYNNSEVTLAVGDRLIVTLDSNATTGYSWNLSAISDASVIAKVSDEYVAPTSTPPLMGQGGQESWTFEALDAGIATISMKYIRSWEPEEPAETFEITVNVE
jgi:predicted secreted protein